MDTPRASTQTPAGRAGPDERRAPRRAVRGVRCRVRAGAGWLWVGAGIIDFSTKGVRLRTLLPWEAGQTRRIRLGAGPVRLELEATCVWARPEGGWRRVVGAAFQGVTPAEEGLLAELLARHGVEPAVAAAA